MALRNRGLAAIARLKGPAGLTAICKKIEKHEKRFIGGLIAGEPEPPALRHVGHAFNRAAEIGIGVPGLGEARQIGGSLKRTLYYLGRCMLSPWDSCAKIMHISAKS